MDGTWFSFLKFYYEEPEFTYEDFPRMVRRWSPKRNRARLP